ncbi:hypothetical protein [Micromonospora sp. NPDC049891]|uniref:hypothetical protein n=1 Tax=Micromonospora sp. NPDC049891 TaxID=3155655 RepID=UPI0033EBF8B0
MTVVDGARLMLVRHAMPVVEPTVPAERWLLGPDGRAAARALRPLVIGPAYYVASSEPKAVQTVQEIAGHTTVSTDTGLVEVRRPHQWSDTLNDLAGQQASPRPRPGPVLDGPTLPRPHRDRPAARRRAAPRRLKGHHRGSTPTTAGST